MSFVSVLRSYITDIYILPSSVDTAGRRGVLFYHLPVHIVDFTLTIVFMAQAKQVSNCCQFVVDLPVKQVISRKLILFLCRYVCPLGFFHRGHRGYLL